MAALQRIRVLVADDSAAMRQTLRRIISADPALEVLDTARDGEDVVAKARQLRPDVVSMDINMPKLDGISALQHIVSEGICPVVMVSSLTHAGEATTFEALELGAFDFVGKPNGTVSDLGSVAQELRTKLRAAAEAGTTDRLSRHRQSRAPRVIPRRPPETSPSPRAGLAAKAVVIGISTGGPSTIQEVLPLIPADADAVFFLVQHMPASFTNAFARRLDDSCALKVVEASAGTEVRAGHCYVGKGDLHLTVYRAGSKVLLRTPSSPDTLFRPSVSVTMESVLAIYGENTIGVLMTGIGSDGADQMVRIKQAGGYTIAESRESAVVFGMPREAIERGGACEVLPSWEVAQAILRRL